MQTIYIYLSEAGWAWFAVVALAFGIASGLGWRPRFEELRRRELEASESETSEADQAHEQ